MEVHIKHTSKFLLDVVREASMTVEVRGWMLDDEMLHMNTFAYGDGDFTLFEEGLDSHDLVQSWDRLADWGDQRQYWIGSHPSIRDREGVKYAEAQHVFLRQSLLRPEWDNWRSVVHGRQENSYRFLDDLEDIGLSPTIEKVRETPQVTAGPVTFPDDLLSVREREVVVTALDLGYFDVPRGCTLADIADEVGISAGMVSKHLVRAQRELFSLLADRE